MNRREFVESLSVGGAALCLAGCASLVTQSVTPVDGVVRLQLVKQPELAKPGGALRVQPAGTSTSILVLRGEDVNGRPAFTAVSPICTHRGCTVEAQGAVLVCPCHGSTFERSGSVVRGPADRPLTAYKTTADTDGWIEIHIGESRQ
jgi:cytochrome b6-f complex iron-sulfur subunit